MNRAVFLDRDGVLNRAVVRQGKPYPPNGLDELEVLSGVPDALAELKDMGFLLIVVTNQPDVARGKQSRAVVEEIHGVLFSSLPLDDAEVCYHDDEDGCNCRKPRPGMILNAAAKHNVNLRTSYLVGDRWRDVEAGQAAGCRTIFIDCGYDERSSMASDFRALSLVDAVNWITKQEKNL